MNPQTKFRHVFDNLKKWIWIMGYEMIVIGFFFLKAMLFVLL